MKTKPWQDIFTAAEWNKRLDDYRRGQTQSKGKRFGDHFKRLTNRGKFPLPRTIRTLDMQIRHYHNTEKRSAENLQRRAGALRTIAGLARSFLAEHDIAGKNELKQNMDEAAYKAYKKKYLDYAVGKLARRAERKAEYIEKLMQHVADADRGFTGGRENLLAYVKSKMYEPDDDELVRMKADVIMERIDPWHRDYEISFNPENNKYGFRAKRGDSVYGAALYQWLNDNRHANTPFFVWLEGHYVCTGVSDQRIEDGNYTESSGHVNYYRADEELSEKTSMIAAHNGLLWVYQIVSDGGVDIRLYDTQHVGGTIKTAQKEAYVWSRDGLIFAGEHIGGQFHHSSFLSGRKVRCAGMINVSSGKVKLVDNDSGHYKPQTRHLRNFAQFLDRQNVFLANARVIDKSTKPDTRVSFEEFLAGDRTVRIRRALQALKTKQTTLRDLVEKRFQAMRIDIGPSAPEHALWTRAYKEVCLEFAELDQSWNRRANAPPIPRSQASRPR
jgi:hypothetical protein